MNQEHISKIIKDIRKKYNLTQKDLASSLGVTYQAVSKWENAKNIPDIELINLMCQKYNIDINEFLNGKKKNSKLVIILIIITLFLVSIFICYKIFDHNNFTFSKITTSCHDFKLFGTIAYNKDKTSIYISNITKCEEDNEVYKKADCTFYEEYNNTKKIISNCTQNKENMTINEYLENMEISIDSFDIMCKTLKNSNLYLEINGYLENNKRVTYKIPLILENCD